MNRLESDKVIRGWMLVFNPNALGLRLFAIWMVVDPRLRIEDVVRKIRLVHGVISIARQVGDVLGVGLLCENERVFRKRAELVAELVGTKELTTYAVNHPKTEIELTPTDWEIINALRPNPMTRDSDLAKTLGLARKTVQRKLSRLIQGNVFFIVPNFDISRLEGTTCADLFVSYTASRFKHAVDGSIVAKFEDYVLRVGWGNENYGHFEFLIPNIKIAQDIVDWARGLNGVKEVKLNFIFEWLNFAEDTMDEILLAKFGTPSATKGP